MDKNEIQKFLKIVNAFGPSLEESERIARRSRVASDGSQSSPRDSERIESEELLSLSMDYQLTVRLKNSSLTRRQISILLGILNYQAVFFGINFGMYLAMEFLSSNLLGNKLSSIDIKDSYERLTVFVSQVILSSIGGRELNLERRIQIPYQLREALIENDLIMSRRTYGSRFSTYRPESLLQILTVPLNVLIERQKGTSEPYSSYCKGYGESHPSARIQRTKPSFELDGDTKVIDYLTLLDNQKLLILNVLDLRYKSQRKR